MKKVTYSKIMEAFMLYYSILNVGCHLIVLNDAHILSGDTGV